MLLLYFISSGLGLWLASSRYLIRLYKVKNVCGEWLFRGW